MILSAGCRLLLIAVSSAALAAADPAAEALEQLRAANQARSELAREQATWTTERQRLDALIAATDAETARLTREAVQAEGQRDAARTRLATLGTGSDLDALRAQLAEAGTATAVRLRALAANLPPGVIALGDDISFDAVVRALDGAEHAAGTVTVEVVSGSRDGHAEAVKLLRVAGAAAWWVALDGQAAGSAAMRDGTLVLTAVVPAEPIYTAVAQAEGRGSPAIVLLPGVAP